VADISQQIKELESKIKSAKEALKIFKEGITELKQQSNTDQQTIISKEKELKELANKLVDCDRCKDQIQQDLNDKVIELENSNLEKEVKKDQIIKLLTKNGLASNCKELVGTWQAYAKSKDEFIKLLEIRSEIDQGAIKRLEGTKQNQQITI
jgi:phosphoglycerate-specific signal transduction histidine kinase